MQGATDMRISGSTATSWLTTASRARPALAPVLTALALSLVGCGGGTGPSQTVPPVPQGKANDVVLTSGGAEVGSAGVGSAGTVTPTEPLVSVSHPRVLLNHAPTLAALKKAWQDKTPAALRFQQFVDNELAHPGTTYGYEAWHAALLWQVTGQAKYADAAMAVVDQAVKDDEALIAKGEAPSVAHDSYLYVGGGVGNVALVYDWCHDRLSTQQRLRWVAYMNQAVSNVWHPDTATWGGKAFPWSGWSVNNPSNNYYYSFLRATMLAGLATSGENDQAEAWLQQFRQTKIQQELVPAFLRDLAGGGSREGTGYGVSMKGLFQLYDWWERSTGERIATLTPHALASEAWMLHAIVPTLDRLAALGDQARDSSVWLFDYHREYLLSLMALFPKERMSGAAQAVLAASTSAQMNYGFEFVHDYLYAPGLLSGALPSVSLGDLATAYWGPGTGQLFTRASWTDRDAAYASFTCGPYTESHAHMDQGAFQIYRSEWLAPTSNIYSHSGIEGLEEHNNLVRLLKADGTELHQGATAPDGSGACQMQALLDTSDYTYAVARLSPVYADHPEVTQVEREFVFIKPATFVVFDRVANTPSLQRVWNLNLPPAKADATIAAGVLSYSSDTGKRLDVHRLAPAGLPWQLSRASLPGDFWLDNAAPQRAQAVQTGSGATQFLHVLGTQGSVVSAVRSDATGQTGAQITLKDGRVVRVRFGTSGAGNSTLEIRQADGTLALSQALPSTVTAPPLFAR